jgi:hypothetical protein
MVAVAAGLIAAGCSDTPDKQDSTKRDESGAIIEAGSLGISVLRVGDCFNDAESTESSVASVNGVPCADDHTSEVYHQFDLAEDATYPDTSFSNEEVAAGCTTAFETYVGVAYEASTVYDITYVYPDRQSWGQGDRKVICALTPYDGVGPLTGSGKGAAK